MEAFALRGNFIWTDENGRLCLRPRSFGVCDESGLCAGVFDTLPERYAALPARDLGELLIVPGYTDLHTHAAQYRNVGLGMDHRLIDWLSELTYPEEARFSDPDFAREVYARFTDELRLGFTTRAVIFASAHREATETLMDLLDRSGLKTLVGKVNMDRNAPDHIREPDAAFAAADTEQWLTETMGKYENTRPILTPRFIPSCTPETLAGLAALREKYDLPVQSHLDEQPEEIAWVRELMPESESYAAAYDEYGLLGPKTVMAHCIYMTDDEISLMKRRGAFIAHCPSSNANVRSGIAPIRKYLGLGMNVGLGTDISGGSSLDMADAVRDALSASRLLWRLGGETLPHLTTTEAFGLATAGGGAFFGKVGRFEPGYEFDAVAADDSAWRWPDDDMERRFEKLVYRARSSDVKAKYVAGRKIL